MPGKKLRLHIDSILRVITPKKELSVMTNSATPTQFSRPRFALLVLIAPMMVAIMIWGVIPVVQTRFRSFINPAVGESK
jgi:hypothetical protein